MVGGASFTVDDGDISAKAAGTCAPVLQIVQDEMQLATGLVEHRQSFLLPPHISPDNMARDISSVFCYGG